MALTRSVFRGVMGKVVEDQFISILPVFGKKCNISSIYLIVERSICQNKKSASLNIEFKRIQRNF